MRVLTFLSINQIVRSECMFLILSLVASFSILNSVADAFDQLHEIRDIEDMLRSRLSPGLVDELNLRNHSHTAREGLDTYVRISILAILFMSIVVLGYLVVFGVSKWMSPSIFEDKRKLRYMVIDSLRGKMRGRNQICVTENGCSGGTMNKCTDPECYNNYA
jgi:hypothetical protein